ncbi:MAG TPA: NAD(P)/FAD-dependent oxidoreductase [Clostridiales bacterium]|nr:NAD(P)/FAD-dependent oxidoreductase [Clostridiales bacterium]
MGKILVVGGGPAGFMAAISAARYGDEVFLLEKNNRYMKKLLITGKGRCNVTNYQTLLNELIEAVPVNGRFLFSAFSKFMPTDTMDFFEDMGVPLKVERGNRVFPESDKSSDIADALYNKAKKLGVNFLQGRAVKLILEDGELTGVKTENETIKADRVIIATGGLSYPQTGSTGDGYKLAKEAGHTIVPLKPALVPIETKEDWCRDLMGLTLKNIAISVVDSDTYREVYNDFGEMLFSHFGVSGPVILSASSHMKDAVEGKYKIIIDLKPALNYDKLDNRILRDLAEFANKGMSNALAKLLPKALIPVVLRLSEIPHDLKANQLRKEQRAVLVNTIKNLTVTFKKFRPIEEAIVTSGGVSVKEINPKTMESKLIKGLYFAGEIIDVNAYTGGYNLQIAFSTGYLAGESAAESLRN